MQTLNDKLFNLSDPKMSMHEDVRNKLVDITNTFIDELREEGLTIYPADVRLVGSNAGFDYTSHSDIDLHIIVNSELYSCDVPVLQAALNLSRKQFNDQYNISVKGIKVEIYVEDIKSASISNGIYSILQNRWIKFPQEEKPFSDYITPEIKEKAYRWQILIQQVLEADPQHSSVRCEEVLTDAEHLLNRLYLMRKSGLESGGRLSEGNLIFKQVRNSGMLDALKEKLAQIKSFSLTLESLRRSYDG